MVVGVGIEDEVAVRGREAAAQGRPVAAVAFVPHDAQPRAHLRLQGGQLAVGGVAAAVVDDHDLVGAGAGPRRRRFAHGALDVVGLVVGWQDEGDRWARHSAPWQSP